MQHNNQTPVNPHSQAASAYGTNAQKNSPDQREIEARVLLKAAKMLQDLKNAFDEADAEAIETVLHYNRQIWMMFYDTAIENKGSDHTSSLRSNIINLANFIFKRETEILGTPKAEKLDALISINREIAAGLMGNTGE